MKLRKRNKGLEKVLLAGLGIGGAAGLGYSVYHGMKARAEEARLAEAMTRRIRQQYEAIRNAYPEGGYGYFQSYWETPEEVRPYVQASNPQLPDYETSGAQAAEMRERVGWFYRPGSSYANILRDPVEFARNRGLSGETPQDIADTFNANRRLSEVAVANVHVDQDGVQSIYLTPRFTDEDYMEDVWGHVTHPLSGQEAPQKRKRRRAVTAKARRVTSSKKQPAAARHRAPVKPKAAKKPVRLTVAAASCKRRRR